ncbi:MAG: mechanosensitive ion channel family protein [Erysipelotrichaceae bacterium]|nr:mechanosensitive ion channel family protein [Erysipelotrichaceae bacterium]
MIISIIVTLVFLTVFTGILSFFFMVDLFSRGQDIVDRKTDDVEVMINNAIAMNMDLYEDYEMYSDRYVSSKIRLLQELFRGDKYYGPELFEDGIVLRKEDGQLIYPELKGKQIPYIEAERIDKEYGQYIDESGEDTLIITYKQIKDSYYYVDWTKYGEYMEYFNQTAITDQLFEQTEKAYDGYLLIRQYNQVVYNGLSSIGVEDSDVVRYIEELSSSVPSINGHQFIVGHRRIENRDLNFYFLQEIEEVGSRIPSNQIMFVSLSLLIILTMLTWNYAVNRLVEKHVLSADQQKFYHPVKVRRINLIAMIIGAVLIFSSLQYTQVLNDLVVLIKNGKNVLDVVSTDVYGRTNQDDYLDEELSLWNVYYAQEVSKLLSAYPELRDQKLLKEVSDILEIEYITLYDEAGKELLCSNGYKGLSLEADMSDFQILNNGRDYLIRKDLDDKLVDKKIMAVGVSIPLENKDLYGALVFNLSNYHKDFYEENLTTRIRSMIMDGDLFMIAEKESGLISECTDEEFTGTYVSNYNIDPQAKDMMNYFNIQGKQYYGLSKTVDENIFYYFIDASLTTLRSGAYSIIAAVMFAIMYLVSSKIILKGYNNKFFEENVLTGEAPLHDEKITVDTAGGRNKKTIEAARRYEYILHLWNEMLPERKALSVFYILTLVIVAYVFYQSQRSTYSSIMGYILQGNWNRGMNIFAFTSIGLLLVAIILIMIIVRIVFVILVRLFDTKGETISRLIYNFLQYLAFFCFLYYAFGYLGINTTALLASAGFISLAISLGSRDLVADILAGLTIVFEGDFQVGDMVDIAGYRGKVTDIGVRSTKLLGRGDNIKIISNRDIKNVINLTKLNSWLPLEIVIDAEKIDEAEKVLEEQLPLIGKKHKEIINGPYYYGILKVSEEKMTLSILTECKEEDYNKIQRILNREVYQLLKNRQIEMK